MYVGDAFASPFTIYTVFITVSAY